MQTLAPPVSFRVPLSGHAGSAVRRRFPAVFGGDLLTGPTAVRPKIALRGRILSRPVDWADLIRLLKILMFQLLRQGGGAAWFELHLPEKAYLACEMQVRIWLLRWCFVALTSFPYRRIAAGTVYPWQTLSAWWSSINERAILQA